MALFVFVGCTVLAETGKEAWLRYQTLDSELAKNYASLPAQTVLLGDSLPLKSAQREPR